jgi:DNA-3-methyladenine glycosylase
VPSPTLWRPTSTCYGPPGTAYVYLIYGLYHCFNIACGPADTPWAVLIRALEPVEGLDAMRAPRSASPTARAVKDASLCVGPGRLCRALAIDRSLDGTDLVSSPSLYLCAPASRPPDARPPGDVADGQSVRGPRVGVDYAGEWARAPLRFRTRRG